MLGRCGSIGKDVKSLSWKDDNGSVQTIAYSLEVQKKTQRLLTVNAWLMIFLILTIVACTLALYSSEVAARIIEFVATLK